ncbi:transmembrane protein, putative (macronuclear) [Tetrahymena thermophila SB210]|uniref:Transmembrane protein, putative n=1 Tax=Tetrahymena thermophila (strain SB210) TaxID=312017 RepID=I7MDM3_TETTS|nr:transmembrane protein, putative [Tetrahymena thermophila SB210]EAR89399.4 transmembrane protein, putative [Tetrahymena thermophila SB210]|eukprot:XP_001009644.4 transmembrane protein, putative [Tetrahymena thermophila SB210]
MNAQNNNILNIFSQPIQDKKDTTQAGNTQSALFSNNFGAPMSNKQQNISNVSSESSLQISNNIFGSYTNLDSQQKNTIDNLFGQNNAIKNNQNTQQNAIYAQPGAENKNNSSLFQSTNSNLFQSIAQKTDSSKNMFSQPANIFNPTNNDINNSLFQKNQSPIQQQNQSPAQSNLFSTNSSPFFQQGNQQQNLSLIGNQQSLFQANQDQQKNISPKSNTFFMKVQEIQPQKLDFLDQKVDKTKELQDNMLQNKSLGSPKFGQTQQILNDKDQGYQKSDAQDTDSIDKLDFNDNKSEEEEDDDQGLADFPNRSFVAQKQQNDYDAVQSRFNSNKQEDEDDQNLEVFGPRDTRVAEQDLSVQKEQRIYQKIDMQKKISDLEIEIDYYKKQISTQQKTIQDLQNQMNKILEDNSKVLSQQKEIFNSQLKRAESTINKAFEQNKLLEKRYGFEIMKIALIRKMELTKNQNQLQTMKEELEKTKLILNNYKFKNDELEIIKQQYIESQKKDIKEEKVKQKYDCILEKLNSLIIKYNNQDIKDEALNSNQNEQLSQIHLNSQQLQQQQEQDTLHQLEQILLKYQNNLKMQSERLNVLPNISTQFEIEKQKFLFTTQKLQQQIEQYVLQSLKLEQENREIKMKFQEQENVNYKNTKLNEELKAHYNQLIEYEKNKAKDLLKEKNMLLKSLIVLIIIFASFLIRSLLF